MRCDALEIRGAREPYSWYDDEPADRSVSISSKSMID
jgi:hypothetical protein